MTAALLTGRAAASYSGWLRLRFRLATGAEHQHDRRDGRQHRQSDDDPTLAAAVAAGASGYVLKGAGQQELQAAIAAAAAGQSVFSPGLAARLLAGTAPPQAELAGLTPRERDIVNLLATGCSTASIADQLYLSPKTVSNHLTTIFEKLGVANRAEAIVLAQRSGWGRR